MIYYFKDGKWTAISNSSARYWEIKEFGNARKLELNLPQLSSFGWERTTEGYKRKDFTTQEFINYLKEYRKEYEIMIRRIDEVLREAKK
jgi:hypothetical protein